MADVERQQAVRQLKAWRIQVEPLDHTCICNSTLISILLPPTVLLLAVTQVGCDGGSQQPRGASRAKPAQTKPAQSVAGSAGATQFPSNDQLDRPQPHQAHPPEELASGLLATDVFEEDPGGHNPGLENEAELLAPPEWDDELLVITGIRKLAGTYLTLYTDLPSAPSIDDLPAIFDQAVAQWCGYFELPHTAVKSWRINGYLMRDRERFRGSGMYPGDLPPFQHGFQRGAELWLYEQPSSYYRRHLLLHEGTHAFMKWTLGGAGPPWFMEGVAELLATHRWIENELTLHYFPRDKGEVSHWGRVKKIKEELKQGRNLSLTEIMRYDTRAHLRVAPYAWCWAAASFLDNHPVYRHKFRQLREFASDSSLGFSQRYSAQLAEEGPHLEREWQLFVNNIEYGYNVAREAIERKPVAVLPPTGATVTIMADRGWQSSGYRLEQGQPYRIEARGRYQIAKETQILWCEPNGISLRFHRGLPLGILVGALIEEGRPGTGITRLATPDRIGLGCETRVERAGTLYLRVNDSPAELDDNVGKLTVKINLVEALRNSGTNW